MTYETDAILHAVSILSVLVIGNLGFQIVQYKRTIENRTMIRILLQAHGLNGDSDPLMRGGNND